MKKNKTISGMSGLFIGFNFSRFIQHYNEMYVSMKHNIVDSNFIVAITFGLELLSFLIVAVCICLFVKNCNKQDFFAKQNYCCFYIMAAALCAPIIIYDLIRIFSSTLHDLPEEDFFAPMSIGIFMLFLAEIFRYGYRLKKEQDLTI